MIHNYDTKHLIDVYSAINLKKNDVIYITGNLASLGKFNGIILNNRGEGVIAQFEITTDSIKCAVDIQRQFRMISLDNPSVFNMKLKVSYKRVGFEEVIILDKKRELILIEENIENSYIRWKYSNKYWVDKNTGYVWESIQEIAPDISPIFIQIRNKPS